MNKKWMAVSVTTLICTLALTACNGADPSAPDGSISGQSQPPISEPQFTSSTQEPPVSSIQTVEEVEPEAPIQENNILVAYFSWADNAVLDGEVDAIASPSVVAPGNVAQLAGWVQEKTGGDLFSIRVTEPYSSDWDECLERANQERGDNARPELVELVDNMQDYDTIFLGYPNWWYGAPMPLLSFLESHDLSGKQIYLFCSHGTGGLAGSVDNIESVLPESAELSDQIFDVYEEEASSSQNHILTWLDEIGY